MSTTSELPPDPSQAPPQKKGRSDPWLLALKQIDFKRDLSNLPNIPCSRQSLLLGIGGGVGVGAIRYLSSRRVLGSTNWAVATFAVLSLTSWETCRRSRAKEQEKMKAAMQDFKAKSKGKASNDGSNSGDEQKVHHHAPVGGIFLGEKGKEILKDRQHPASTEDAEPKRLV